jgi:hypothetical protein
MDHAVVTVGNQQRIFFPALDQKGRLRREEVRRTTNFETGGVALLPQKFEALAYQSAETLGPPASLSMGPSDDLLYLVWRDGHFQRLNTRQSGKSEVAEQGNFLEGSDAHVTAVHPLLGR